MSSLLNTYNRRKISFKKGEGSYLYSINNKKYLDFVQGIAVNCLGHANKNLIKAVNSQAKKVWHVSNAFVIPEQEKLAKKLTKNTFADYVAFQNSGAEATEAAIKFARRYFYSIGQPKKNRILCVNGSFHGRTLATVFASNNKKAMEGYYPKVEGFDHFNYGDHKGMEKAITNKTAAIMLEPILGEGGIKVIPDYCLQGLRKICNKKKILLILDEVQCGIGRTGKFFAFEHAKIKPDIVPIAKGIGGGFPLGACLVNKKVAAGMKPGTHGTTFGGNPLAMNVGNAVLDIVLQKSFLKNVQKNSKYFHNGLNKLKYEYPKVIQEVRGLGMLIGLKLNVDQTEFIRKLTENKLLTIRAAENVVRILPPLNVKKKEIDLAIAIIRKVCKNYK
jgi:acetylornithine/N-succinyldiaminopimelate aminotransferase|tara:strand:- start:153 stop:1319 length:1167 start_codon:yes stop_codon:yes gene_type:complete